MASLASEAPAPFGIGERSPRFGSSLWIALGLTLLLSFAWAARDWGQLSLGRLPDNDDMMRLAQVRDWLGGQALNDLSQHRLGPPGGAAMHWSRLADIGPALLLLLLRPLLGAGGAELAMAVLYPALLFLAYLLLMGRIAARLMGESAAPIAVLAAAFAFPTISLFLPGRIDHHGLQIVLIQLLVLALVARPSFASGLAAGTAAAASLAVGLEAAPEIAGAMAALSLLWLLRGAAEDRRALGFALGMGAATGALLLLLRPQVWPDEWCDGFTPASTSATLAAAACWALLALAGRAAPRFRPRLLIGAAVAGVGAFAAFRTSAVCATGPYGALDPALARLWMQNVGEALPLYRQDDLGATVAFGGLCLAGGAAALHQYLSRPEERARWLGFTIFLTVGVAAAVAQIRVTYIMAAFATLPLCALVLRARGAAAAGGRFAGLAVAAAWLLSCGLTYNVAGTALAAAAPSTSQTAARAAQALCTDGAGLAHAATLPPGTIMSPLDSSAYFIGMTPHRLIAGPYHRNNIGNRASYAFFLSPPERARAVAERWSVDYVVICPTSFIELDLARGSTRTLGGDLLNGRPPDWLEPIPGPGSLAVYRVRSPGR